MKKCNKCGIEKDLEEFSIKRNKKGREYYQGRCKVCIRAIARAKNVPRDVCRRCGVQKDLNKSTWCKPCALKYAERKRIETSTRIKPTRKQIKRFVDDILSNDMKVSLNDINDIITNYMAITKSYNEYDNYSPGLQVIKMFTKLMKYSSGWERKHKDGQSS